MLRTTDRRRIGAPTRRKVGRHSSVLPEQNVHTPRWRGPILHLPAPGVKHSRRIPAALHQAVRRSVTRHVSTGTVAAAAGHPVSPTRCSTWNGNDHVAAGWPLDGAVDHGWTMLPTRPRYDESAIRPQVEGAGVSSGRSAPSTPRSAPDHTGARPGSRSGSPCRAIGSRWGASLRRDGRSRRPAITLARATPPHRSYPARRPDGSPHDPMVQRSPPPAGRPGCTQSALLAPSAAPVDSSAHSTIPCPDVPRGTSWTQLSRSWRRLPAPPVHRRPAPAGVAVHDPRPSQPHAVMRPSSRTRTAGDGTRRADASLAHPYGGDSDHPPQPRT